MDFSDDPVREEHDIYLSKELSEQLYLLQFPLRPKGRPYPDPVSGKFKPEHEILKLNYTLPKDDHFDENAPEKQSINEISMQSSRNPAKATYAVGVTHNGSIYLTPVKSTLVMRPDISYFNKSVDIVDDDDMDDGGEAEQEQKPKGKQKSLTEIKIEYSKRRNDENHFGPLTHAEVASSRNEEPWIDKKVYGPTHSSSYSKFESLESCSEIPIPSSSSLPMFIDAMHQQAAHEYADSAADPQWKVLSSLDYPGHVDSKEWREKRQLRNPKSF